MEQRECGCSSISTALLFDILRVFCRRSLQWIRNEAVRARVGGHLTTQRSSLALASRPTLVYCLQDSSDVSREGAAPSRFLLLLLDAAKRKVFPVLVASELLDAARRKVFPVLVASELLDAARRKVFPSDLVASELLYAARREVLVPDLVASWCGEVDQ